MNRFITTGIALLMLIIAWPATAVVAEDLRVMSIQEKKIRSELLQKVAREKQMAENEARETRRLILEDRENLAKATRRLKAEIRTLEAAIKTGQQKLTDFQAEDQKLSANLDDRRAANNELIGHIRILAKDIDALLTGSFGQVLQPEGRNTLAAIATRSHFPGMQELQLMAALLEEEIRSSGEVRLVRGPMVDRSGKAVTADLLFLGNFTAAYRSDDDSGYLNYLPGSRKLFALQKPSPGRLRNALQAYLAGETESVPLDITRGGALQQLSHHTSLLERFSRGGPIVWPILVVLLLGAAIIIERIIYLYRKAIDADSLMNRMNTLAACEEWDACRALCNRFAGKPVSRVLQAGLECRQMGREAMENVLQEAILQEIPGLERFLSTLGMLAAIAPLLGLLGTVTGMINTFDMITHYGTGNPRMMSGGISEALITTMLGLSVAIPILLCHTLLSRRVETTIAQMEEKAVAFTNIIYKTRMSSEG